jgi:hypothetical protein
MKEYLIGNLALNTPRQHSVSEAERTRISKAMQLLLSAYEIEDQYSYVLSRFQEFERIQFDLSLRNATENPGDIYSYHSKDRIETNKILSSFLSEAVIYLDHTVKKIAKAASDYSPGNEERNLDSILSEEYDSTDHYGFMYKARNYCAHRGHVIERISYTGKHIDEKHTVYRVALISKSPETITEKKDILEKNPNPVDISDYSRKFMSSINSIHLKIKNELSFDISSSRDLISSYVKIVSDGQNDGVGVCLMTLENNIRIKEEDIPLNLKWDDIRMEKTNSVSYLHNLSNVIITNHPIFEGSS